MRLEHPNSKTTVETDNPEAYLSQGWVEKESPKTSGKSDDK